MMIGAAALSRTASYRAAVVHGNFPNVSTSATDAEQWVQAAAKQGAQLVTFAEGGLGSNTAFDSRDTCEPLPSVGAALCGNASIPLASAMSCLAQKYDIYIVMAMCDVQPCNRSAGVDCSWAERGWFHFNTQIALSPSGRLIAKYHKVQSHVHSVCSAPPA